MKAAPYPADTRAKGWRFELDYEQIEQSSTWSVAKPAARPWLLMMWMLAWKQVPCGSWPADEEVIAGALGIDEDQWTQHRKALMRGWLEAEDGRMYHPTITKRVIEMLGKRRSDSDRQAAKRAREAADAAVIHDGVTRDNDASHAVVGSESSTDHRPPTTSSPAVKKTPRKRADDPPCPEGVESQVWSDWLALRRAKKAPVTATVIVGAAREADRAGMTLEAFLSVWCRRGSQGLEADWLKPHERNGTAANGETNWERSRRERVTEMSPSVARKAPGAKPEKEIIDVAAIQVG